MPRSLALDIGIRLGGLASPWSAGAGSPSYTQARVDNQDTASRVNLTDMGCSSRQPAFTFSAWFRVDTVVASVRRLFGCIVASQGIIVQKTSGGELTLAVRGYDDPTVGPVTFHTLTTTSLDLHGAGLGVWHHVHFSGRADTDLVTGNINGTSLYSGGHSYTPTHDYDWIGGTSYALCSSNTGGAALWVGALADMQLFFGSAANADRPLSQFYVGGSPVDPSTISSTSRILLLQGPAPGAGTWTNGGTGGDYAPGGGTFVDTV